MQKPDNSTSQVWVLCIQHVHILNQPKCRSITQKHNCDNQVWQPEDSEKLNFYVETTLILAWPSSFNYYLLLFYLLLLLLLLILYNTVNVLRVNQQPVLFLALFYIWVVLI